MRTPTYLSYSAMSQFEKNRKEFFLTRLADSRPPRRPQEKPASIGSAFDAFVKAALHEALFGRGADPKYELEALMESQVEPHNRDWAWEEGRYVFDGYKLSGRYDALLELLQKSTEPPRFEFDVHTDICGGVPFLAKPDCYFKLNHVHVVHDFKVNGYCSKSSVSPSKGYMLCTDCYTADKQSRSHGTAHKQHEPVPFFDLEIDSGGLEDSNVQWADQLTLYGWAMGEPVGADNVVVSIDQLVWKPLKEGRPLGRCAHFRARVRKSYQEYLDRRVRDCWKIITSQHIFDDLPRAESDALCEQLDLQAKSLHSDGTPEGDFFAQVVRAPFRG